MSGVTGVTGVGPGALCRTGSTTPTLRIVLGRPAPRRGCRSGWTGTFFPMAFFKTLLKGAVATKLLSEARKPENQAKAKSAARSLQAKLSSRKGNKGPR